MSDPNAFFTMIPSTLANAPWLSFEARGVFAFMASFCFEDDDDKVDQAEMDESGQALPVAALIELEQAGYISRIDGQWRLFEEPLAMGKRTNSAEEGAQ